MKCWFIWQNIYKRRSFNTHSRVLSVNLKRQPRYLDLISVTWNKDTSVTSSVTCIPRMIQQQEQLPKIMPNYNGVPLTSFISRVFKKSILLIPNTPSLHYPSEKPLKRRRTRPSMPRGLRQAGFMRLKRSAWFRSCRFLSTRCRENSTRRCCQKKTKNTEDWRLKMNEPRKVNSFWPWKGIIWKGSLHTTTILQDLCSFSHKSMSASLESECELRFFKKEKQEFPHQFRMNSTLLSRGHSFTGLKPFHQQGSLLDSGNGLSVDHLIP